MKLKTVMRSDRDARLFRLVRLMGGGDPKSGGPWWKLSLGLRPKILQWRREYDGWIFIVFGVRVHWRLSRGGVFV